MKQNRSVISPALAGVVVLSLALFAQAPTPGPELKKLDVFVGSWTAQVDAPASVFGPAGKHSVTERWQWMPGGFFLQMNREGKGPDGDYKHMLIFGYDRSANQYTAAWFGNTGGTGNFTGTNAGNTWNWAGRGVTDQGKAFQERCTATATPGTAYTLKCEASGDGKTFTPSWDARFTKSK